MNNKLLKWINTVSYVALVAFNALANVLKLGGNTTGGVSAKYPTLITPAPITFAIWGVIYGLLGLFILYIWGVFGNEEKADNILNAVGYGFLITCILNILWLTLWHFEMIGFSVIAIAGLLITLVIVQKRLIETDKNVTGFFTSNLGFYIYYGWITVAVITNIAVFLKSVNWNGFGVSDEIWAVIILFIGIVLGMLISLKGKNIIATLAVVWGYIGILIRHLSKTGYDTAYPAIIITLIAGIIAMLATSVLVFYRKSKSCK